MARHSKPDSAIRPVNIAVRNLRRATKWTQQELAKSLGVAGNTVARWESFRTPDRDSCVKLAEMASTYGLIEEAKLFMKNAPIHVQSINTSAMGDNTVGLRQVRETYTISELQEVLGVGKHTVYKLLNEKIIPSVRIGRNYIVPKVAVHRFLNEVGLPPGTSRETAEKWVKEQSKTDE